MNRSLRIAAMLAATAALSGCASIFGHHSFADNASPEEAAPAQPDGNVELAAAKQAMDAGMTAEAIDHYRAAQMDPNALPAASNGLGVAYARLGRLDLADRYFRIAVALEPSNQRFAANMLRLQNGYALAQARQSDAPQLAAATAPAPAPAQLLAVTDRPGELERVSRGEVHIRTASIGAAAPIAVVASRDPAPVPAVEKLAGGDGAAAIYPVRIDLARPAPSKARKPIAAAYPQRIELAKVVVAD
jgi:tetratricopeptide (TPR) repeat protein